MGKMRNAYKIFVGKPENHLRNLRADIRIMLKLILSKWCVSGGGGGGMDLTSSEYDSLAGSLPCSQESITGSYPDPN
jgi:hypothetical protein